MVINGDSPSLIKVSRGLFQENIQKCRSFIELPTSIGESKVKILVD